MTLPASDSYSTYGGELVNYSDVEDPNTDLDAEASNQLRATAAGISATCFRVIFSFSVTSPSETMFLNSLTAVWDTTATAAPTMTRLQAGQYQFVFPTQVTDLRGNLQYYAFLGGIANPDIFNGNGFYCTVQKAGLANTTVQVFCQSSIDGTLEDLSTGQNITVMLR